MKCPVCGVPLQMTDRQGIEIDYCPECRGVWLDRGELDKLIERSASHEAGWGQSSSAPGRAQHGKHGDYRQHKKKSLWREIFDIG